MKDTLLTGVTVCLLLFAAVTPVAANSSPTATIEYTPDSPVVEERINFDGSGSTDSDGSIEEYEWDLDGDGDYGDNWGDDTGQTTETSFGTAGTYTVGLRVTDDSGASSTTTVSVTVTNDKPEATFTFSPSDPVVEESISLDASQSSDSDGRLTSYEWDLDGDGDYGDNWGDATGQTSSVSFEEDGTYTVGLKVHDNGEKVDTVRKQIEVTNEAPSVQFSFNPQTPVADEKVTFDGSLSDDSDGDITSYEWDLDGDGDYGDNWGDDTGQQTSLKFDTAGSYTVGLKVTDNGGLSSSVRQTVTVTNEAPVPEITVTPDSPAPGQTITFDASGTTDADGDVITYEWDLDGDGDYGDNWGDDTGQQVTKTFEKGGSYTVGLRVTDNGEKSATTKTTVTVVNNAPEAAFSYGITEDGLTVRLDGSESSDSDESSRLTLYEWDIDGDGEYGDYDDATGQNAMVTFESAGSYEIGLRVTDNGGLRDTVRKEIGVSEKPEAEFSVDPLVAAVGQPATFDAARSVDPDGAIEEYRWTFPDGTTKRGEDVNFQFESTGTHTVNLTVVDSSGATATVSKDVQAKRPPEFEVSWSPDTPRDEIDVVFSGNATDAVSEYRWDFDADGDFETSGEKATHTFDETGKHTIRVRAVAPSGVASTKTKVVTVQKSAEFDLTSNQRSIRPGEEVVVTFSVSNLVRDASLEVRLELSLPSEGASISSVSGGEMVSPRATGFVVVPPGEEKSIQVRIQYNDAGEFDIDGNAVYYFGTDDNSSEDRRRSSVSAASVRVREETAADGASGSGFSGTDTGAPGFDALVAVLSVVLAGLTAGTRRT